jgi:signal transduction histidine kinase
MNANDATPPGGSVTVSLTCDTEQLSISIADSGTGIAPEILERVFEPFFTTKQHGTGLGLAISAGIAQSHGGRLRATNGQDRGAIFTVDLPVAAIITPTHDVRLFEEER